MQKLSCSNPSAPVNETFALCVRMVTVSWDKKVAAWDLETGLTLVTSAVTLLEFQTSNLPVIRCTHFSALTFLLFHTHGINLVFLLF